MNIRPGDDVPFLEQKLFEAFFWNPFKPRPQTHEFFANPEFQMYCDKTFFCPVGAKCFVPKPSQDLLYKKSFCCAIAGNGR